MKKISADQEFLADRRQFALTSAAGSGAFLAGCLFGGAGAAIAETTTTSASVFDWNLASKNVFDISHVQEHDMPADPSLTTPTLSFFARVGQAVGAYWNLENVTYTPHTGTHLDSPFHVNSSWGSFETMDPKLLFGPATIVSLSVPSGSYTITAADIQAWEAKNGLIPQGDAVLVHTGHDQYWPVKKTYIDDGYPIFAKDAAAYLVAKKARYVGMETISPDGPNTDAHQILMGGGVMIVENLTGLGKIGKNRCLTIGTFPNMKGETGVYMRLLAVTDK